ncbi:hypothetical protein LTS10_003640 [Elasticomyces elasticus]|nr:hypothetical protein LTS10_003640 [Elasticomyces elasticus]
MEVDLDLTTCWAKGEQYNAGILEIDAFDWGLPESSSLTEVPQDSIAVEQLLVDAVNGRPDRAPAEGEATVIKAPTTANETPAQQATHVGYVPPYFDEPAELDSKEPAAPTDATEKLEQDAEPNSGIANVETELQLDGPPEQHIEQSIRTEFAAAHEHTQQEHAEDEEIEQGEQQLAKSVEALEEPVEKYGELEDAAPRSDAAPGEDVAATGDAKDEAEELDAPTEDFDEFSTLIMDLDEVTAPENAFDAQSTEIKDNQDIDMPQQDQATEGTARTPVVPKLAAASATKSPPEKTLPLRDSMPVQHLQPAAPSSPGVTLPELVGPIRDTPSANRIGFMRALWQQRARSSTPALLPSPMPDVVVRQPTVMATSSAVEGLVNTTSAKEALKTTPDSDVHGDGSGGGGEVIAGKLLANDEEWLLHLIEQATSPVKAIDPDDAAVNIDSAAAHLQSIESPEVRVQSQLARSDGQLKRELSSSPDPLQGPPTKKARLLDAYGVTESPMGLQDEEGEDRDISMGDEHADTSKNDDSLGNDAASLEILKSDLPTPVVTKKTTRAASKASALTDPPTLITAGKSAGAKSQKTSGMPTDSPATTKVAKKPRAISKRKASASSDPAPASDAVKKPRASNKRTLSAAAGSSASADAETTPPAKIRRVSGVSSTEMRALVNQSVQKRITTSPNVKTRKKTQDIAESKPSGAAAGKKRHSKG